MIVFCCAGRRRSVGDFDAGRKGGKKGRHIDMKMRMSKDSNARSCSINIDSDVAICQMYVELFLRMLPEV